MLDAWRVALRVHRLLGRERSGRWALLVGVGIVASGFEMLGALAIYLLLGLLTAPDTVTEFPLVGGLVTLLPARDVNQLRVWMAIVVIAFFVVRAFVLVTRNYLEARVVANAGVLLADRLLTGYVAMPYPFHTRRNSAELIRNAYTSTTQLQQLVMLPLAFLAGDIVVLIGLGIVVLASDPQSAIIAILFLGGVTLAIQKVLRPRLETWGVRSQDAATGSVKAVQQALGGIRDIKLLGQEQPFLESHREFRMKGARAGYLSLAASSIPRALIEFGLVAAVVVLMLLTLASGSSVEQTLSALGLFAYVGLRLQPVLQRMVTSINSIRSGAPIVTDLARDLQQIEAWQARVRTEADESHAVARSASRAPHGDTTPPRLSTAIELMDVSFTYPSEEASVRPALRNVDLRIAKGEFVGICGPTGGGKSTLLDLVIGLLEPTSGQVRIDGRELGAQPTWWWSQLGVVSQQIFLVDDTLRSNIAFGVRDADLDRERLDRCVDHAQLRPMLEGLPSGLDTIVGERGVRLSGGQRQRVAVARALYREPPVLVLDEGTSALDAATESRIITALDAASADRTLIAVAHRIGTIRHADRILVVADGRVQDQGTYDELVVRSRLFCDLAGIA